MPIESMVSAFGESLIVNKGGSDGNRWARSPTGAGRLLRGGKIVSLADS